MRCKFSTATAVTSRRRNFRKPAGVGRLRLFRNCKVGGSPLPADGAHGVARPTNVSVINFSLGTHGNWPDLIASGANVLGIDWQTDLAEARKIIPSHLAMQGNLSPVLLAEFTPEIVATETKKVLETMRGRPGHIFNLGHGLTPAAKLENIAALVETVKAFK